MSEVPTLNLGDSVLRKKPGIVDKLVVHFLQTFLVKK